VCQARIAVVSADGVSSFTSDWKDGSMVEWQLPASLTNGAYRCVIALRDLDGDVSETEAILNVIDGSVTLTEGAPESVEVVVLGHDGVSGVVATTNGDLAFSFGDVIQRRALERMRLTSDGRLGIGTANPAAPLDVRGVIRVSEGIEISDGSRLTSAEGLPGAVTRDGSRANDSAVAVRRPVMLPDAPRNGTSGGLKPRSDVTPDYQFKVEATGVRIGTSTAYGLNVGGDVTLGGNLTLPSATATTGVITSNGVRLMYRLGTSVFLGSLAGNLTNSGIGNTGVGSSALQVVTTGDNNTAVGADAMDSITTGSANVAVGRLALDANVGASYNVAVGSSALAKATVDGNTAVGYQALTNTSTGVSNTAVGYLALDDNTTGSFNIGIGNNAGGALTTGSFNLDIGNGGVAGESNTMRIGNGNQTRAFITGIRGVTTGAQDAVPVYIDSNSQLGTASSSRRYKFDIEDAADATVGLMRLRPVTFRYLAYGPGSRLQYGLIAEEVAEVYPELVVRNEQGEPETVMYQFLAPMLLSEVQKQNAAIDELKSALEEQRRTNDALRVALFDVMRRLDAVEASRRQQR
jgi:hypothetical protein